MADHFLDSKHFEELFRLHFTNLVGYVCGFVKDEEVAKDVVHDAFVTLWNKREQLDISYSLKSYLFTLSQNQALNYLRHKRVVQTNERELGEVMATAVEELQEYESRLKQLEEKLPQLTDKQQEVVMKCIVEGKQYREVAEELGISLSTVKTHMVRALHFLRNEVRDAVLIIWVLQKKIKKS